MIAGFLGYHRMALDHEEILRRTVESPWALEFVQDLASDDPHRCWRVLSAIAKHGSFTASLGAAVAGRSSGLLGLAMFTIYRTTLYVRIASDVVLVRDAKTGRSLAEPPITQIEVRALIELGVGAGASKCFGWLGRDLTDQQLVALQFPQEWEVVDAAA